MKTISRSFILSAVSIVTLVTISSVLFFRMSDQRSDLDEKVSDNQELLDKNGKLKRELSILQEDFNNNSLRLNEMISNFEYTIEGNNKKIQTLIAQNKAGGIVKSQLKEISDQNQYLSSEIESYKRRISEFSQQNNDLSFKIFELENINKQLVEQNNILRSMVAHNINISATKGRKNKLTIVAAKTDHILVKLDVPAHISSNISFDLIYPDNKRVSSVEEKSSTIKVSDTLIMPQLGRENDEAMKSLEIGYKPKLKLKKGMYKLLVYNEGILMTGVSINLK